MNAMKIGKFLLPALLLTAGGGCSKDTADEETGMYGANDLPAGELNGDILLNFDTEVWGEFVIGSAGGIDITATLDYKEVETDKEDAAVKVTLKGLKGGHSGIEINEGRANANKCMVRFVREAISELDAGKRRSPWNIIASERQRRPLHSPTLNSRISRSSKRIVPE